MTATQEYFAEKLKLWTGMFLMFYCVTHYLNHSIGIFGLDAVEYIRNIFLFFLEESFHEFFPAERSRDPYLFIIVEGNKAGFIQGF